MVLSSQFPDRYPAVHNSGGTKLLSAAPLPTALRKAKLEYLHKSLRLGNNQRLSLSHPFFLGSVCHDDGHDRRRPIRRTVDNKRNPI